MSDNEEDNSYITKLAELLKIIQNGKLAARACALEDMSRVFLLVSQIGFNVQHINEEFDQIVGWFRENDVLGVLLRDNLHLFAYVERIEKVLQILMKKEVVRSQDLEQLWMALLGKHDVVQRNMLLLIARLARFMTADLIDKLFELIKTSFKNTTSIRERSLLLEFVRNLVTQQSVLNTFREISKKTFDMIFELYHDKDLVTETIEGLLNVQVTIMSESRNSEALKETCFYKCIEEINQDSDLAIPLFLHIQNCFVDFSNRKRYLPSKNMIDIVVKEDTVNVLIASLCRYMNKVRRSKSVDMIVDNPDIHIDDSMFTHRIHITSRLDCLAFFVVELAENEIYITEDSVRRLWDGIIENPVCEFERLRGFMFFGSNMCRFTQSTNLYIFHDCLITFPTKYFTVSSFNEVSVLLKRSTAEALLCPSQFGKSTRENVELRVKVEDYLQKARAYLWKIILDGLESVAFRAIEFATCEMENMMDAERRNYSSQTFIDECFGRLETFDMSLRQDSCDDALKEGLTLKAKRVIKALKVLLIRYENAFENRINPPLYRAYMGRCDLLTVLISKEESSVPSKKTIKVNSNYTMRYFQTKLEELISRERTINANESIDVLNYRPQPGMSFFEAQLRAAQLLSSMKNDRLPPLHSNIHDAFRYAGKESMKKTLGELCIDESTITAIRITRSKRDTSSYNFVSSMTRGDTPETSADEDSDEDKVLVKDDDFEMQSIILSKNQDKINFLMDFADLAHSLQKSSLRDDIVALLDHLTVTNSMKATIDRAIRSGTLKDTIIVNSPTRTMFNFQVLHTILTPVVPTDPLYRIQTQFLLNNCLKDFFDYFNSSTLDNPDYFSLLQVRILLSFSRMVKFVSTAVNKIREYLRSASLYDDMTMDDQLEDTSKDSYFNYLVMSTLRAAIERENKQLIIDQTDNYLMPSSILKLLLFSSWNSTRGNIQNFVFRKPPTVIQDTEEDNMETNSVTSDSDSSMASSFIDDVMFAKTNDKNELICESLSLEAIDAFICGSQYCPEVDAFFHTPDHLLTGNTIISANTVNNPSFYEFAIDGMLHSSTDRVRLKVAKSLFQMLQNFPEATGEEGPNANSMLDVLFKNLQIAEINYIRANQYFNCLFQLLNHCQEHKIEINEPLDKLNQLVSWLNEAKTSTQNNGYAYQREELLIPYMRTLTHLLRAIPEHYTINMGKSGSNLLEELFDDFLMPFSKAYNSFNNDDSISDNKNLEDNHRGSDSESNSLSGKPSKTIPICRTDLSIAVCFELISEMIRSNPDNLIQALIKLHSNFYQGFRPNITNDPPMPFLQRDPTVFVGLKNAGATCYMNSVLQQLFMIEPFRQMIFNTNLDYSEERKNKYCVDEKKKEEFEYSRDLVDTVQCLFAHLLASDEQFYVPVEFWDTFKFAGHDVNTHEQQDAVEFFNSLADAIDEAFKMFGADPVFEKFFGGTFADQKKCKDCPHVYTTEQLFTSIAVDIRSHNNLKASLNEYVTGDLLEGDNAYFCELCQQKVTAVKRMCFEKLPPYLMFQLKRFDIDWNRGYPIKFFDFFEFPMTLDMEPFTTSGVERKENPNSPTSSVINVDTSSESQYALTKYRLRGVVVHSGEANGGHYYSFIADNKEDGRQQWYQFDDTDVLAWDYSDSEARLHWFGEASDLPYATEKDKRRFSAYMLVYELIPSSQERTISQQVSINTNVPIPSPGIPSPNTNSMDLRFNSMSLHSRRNMANRLPPRWERYVTKSNLKFAHEKFQFSYPYFKFVRDLTRFAALQCSQDFNVNKIYLCKLALRTLGSFIYSTGIRCPMDMKKNIVDDWYWTFNTLMYVGKADAALWFMQYFFSQGNIIHISLLASITNGMDIRQLLEEMIQLPLLECISAMENEENPDLQGVYEKVVNDILLKIQHSTRHFNIDFSSNSQLNAKIRNIVSTPTKFAKKRHFTPPNSEHGSNSSLPSYDAMPTSRKVRHEQSPHTSPVKFPTVTYPNLPTYDECVNEPRSDSLSPMLDSSPSEDDEYTGTQGSDDPPSA